MIFEKAWAVVKEDRICAKEGCSGRIRNYEGMHHEGEDGKAYCPSCNPAIKKSEDASEYCDEVFDVMESHDMGFFEAVMAVARLVGVRGKDLHQACVARMDQMEKADGGMTSSTSGTMNPRHGPNSPGEPTGLKRLQRRSRGARKRSKFPPGYEKGGLLDPNKQKPRHSKEEEGYDKPDHEALLEENKKMTGNMAAKSATNLLYALGLLRKA